MKNYVLLIFGLIIIVLSLYLFGQCERTPDTNNEARLYTMLNETNKSKESFKKLAIKQDEVIKGLESKVSLLEKKKGKIVYRTKFDTLATIDTVLIELVKCDSVVRISDSIIVLKDEVIQAHVEKTEHVYDALNECENAQSIQDSMITSNKKKTRKVKRNAVLKSSIIVALNVASIASPPTAILTSSLSVLVAIIPFNKK